MPAIAVRPTTIRSGDRDRTLWSEHRKTNGKKVYVELFSIRRDLAAEDTTRCGGLAESAQQEVVPHASL